LGGLDPRQVLTVVPTDRGTVPIWPEEWCEACGGRLTGNHSTINGSVELQQSIDLGHVLTHHLGLSPGRIVPLGPSDLRRQEASVAMVDEGGEQDPTDRAGVPPFDPVLGVKLLGEIQAEGLRAAAALVERVVHSVDGPRATSATDSEGYEPPSDGPPATDMSAVLPWFDLWSDLVGRTSDTLQRFRGADSGPAGDGVQIGIDGSLAPTRPLVISVGPSNLGAGEMWLHNGTSEDHGELAPRCGPLSDVHGNVLGGGVEIQPAKIVGLPSRSSRGFVISVVADPSTAPGTYRGTVQVLGAEAVWMPIEVVVPARSP
jgi:hypothetical protein